jgi:hypothetical protein
MAVREKLQLKESDLWEGIFKTRRRIEQMYRSRRC